MIDTQLLITFCGAFGGAFTAFVILKIEVALATQKADDAKSAAKYAHERIDSHINEFHN